MGGVKNKDQAIVVFESQQIRRLWHQEEWWFSVVDVVGVLTEQDDLLKARKYWNKLAQRLRDEGSEVVTNCHQLKMKAPDGKMRKTDCANTEGIFRIIQSIPSPKAEPATFPENRQVARRGGKVAGNARKDTEKELGRSVISKENYLSDQLPDDAQDKLEDK